MNLIVNADDFGKSEAINRTIVELHKIGIVSSTTIMAEGECFKTAVKLAGEHPCLGVGVHLCLDGPFNMNRDPSSIIDEATGRFFEKDQLIQKIKGFRINHEDVYREYCLQIEKVLDHGMKISHLDHHHHLHLYYPVLIALIRAAKKYRIPYIRSQILLFHEGQGFMNKLYRFIHQQMLGIFSNTPEGYFDPCIRSESDYEKAYQRLESLVKAKGRCAEIMLHPMDISDTETRFFRSDRVIQLLKNIAVLNYNNLNSAALT